MRDISIETKEVVRERKFGERERERERESERERKRKRERERKEKRIEEKEKEKDWIDWDAQEDFVNHSVPLRDCR
mgnify:FL=1